MKYTPKTDDSSLIRWHQRIELNDDTWHGNFVIKDAIRGKYKIARAEVIYNSYIKLTGKLHPEGTVTMQLWADNGFITQERIEQLALVSKEIRKALEEYRDATRTR